MLQLTSISKWFGASHAVDDVTLSISAKEIVGLVGENGAGKTTLMRIAAGELAADGGTLDVPQRVELVHQHFMLVGDFTIAENLVLSAAKGPAFLSRRRLLAEAERIVEAGGLSLGDLDRRVDTLSVGERSRVELVKALSRDPELLILDEPTSVLTPLETAQLFDVIRATARRGCAVVFISHKVPEVLELTDRIVVMRGGRIVADSQEGGMSAREVAEAMVGMRTERIARETTAQRECVLRMSRVTCEQLRDVNLEVGHGEIVAIAGVAGNGQSELAAVLRGLLRPRSGTIALEGQPQSSDDLFHAATVGHIPEDRTRDALVGNMTIAENIALTATRWNARQAVRNAERLIGLYGIRAQSARQETRTLSGGNQQKVILARELDRRPELIVAAEPTRGLDVAATNFVHAQLRAAASAGAGILLITSDLDEAFTLADVIHVIYRGKVSERMPAADAREKVATLMAGVA